LSGADGIGRMGGAAAGGALVNARGSP